MKNEWEEDTKVQPADPILLDVCKLRQRTTTKMKAVVWPQEKQDAKQTS